MDLLNAKRSLRVKWYIVALILFEIFLILYEIAIRIERTAFTQYIKSKPQK